MEVQHERKRQKNNQILKQRIWLYITDKQSGTAYTVHYAQEGRV